MQKIDVKLDVTIEQVKKCDKKVLTIGKELVQRQLNPLHEKVDIVIKDVRLMMDIDFEDEEEKKRRERREKSLNSGKS